MSSKRRQQQKKEEEAEEEVHGRSRIITSDGKQPFLRSLEPQILYATPRSERARRFRQLNTPLFYTTNKAD